MAYQITTPQLGIITVTDVDALAPGAVDLVSSGGGKSGRWPQLGSIAMGYDQTLGGGAFIYLKGGALAVGTLVQWDNSYVAAAAASTANSGRPVAVAMSAPTTSQYGWFQLQGKASILKTAVKISPDSRVWLSATSGRFFATQTSGKQILGARTVNSATVASATSTVNVYIQYPIVQGQVT